MKQDTSITNLSRIVQMSEKSVERSKRFREERFEKLLKDLKLASPSGNRVSRIK